ncbi:SdpI family protein [Mucilaginibacter conchicola]|nr:SdpI family protein [Mucilaginibacter conchicola]
MAASSSDIEIANWLIGPQLMGAIFILAALLQKRFPPKNINSLYGYRTPLSMKNQQNWDEANRYSTQLMFKMGLILLVAGIIITPLLAILPISIDAGMLIKVGIMITGALCTIVILLTYTERHLKQTTDKEA